MAELDYREISKKCADIYESLPEDEFSTLDLLAKQVLDGSKELNYDQLYELLPLFMDEVKARRIPLVMYKYPGPYNEPVMQRFRKIAEKTDVCVPSGSSVNLEKPRTLEELIEKLRKENG